MSAASFGTGFVGAANAETFATRCVNAKGYFLVHASTAAPVPTPTPGPPPTPTPQRDASGRLYGDTERVYCSFPNSPNPHLAKVELAAMPCSQGGGVILGPRPEDPVGPDAPTVATVARVAGCPQTRRQIRRSTTATLEPAASWRGRRACERGEPLRSWRRPRASPAAIRPPRKGEPSA
jgi:hypothetical protein